MKFVVLALLVVAGVAYSEPAQGSCPGCPQEQDKSSYETVRPKLTAVLATLNGDNKVLEIIGYKTQIVAGTKHIVTYKNGHGQTCETSWVDQPWIDPPQPQYVNNKCS